MRSRPPAAMPRSVSSALAPTSRSATRSRTVPRNASRSSSGTPTNSPITATGSRHARSSITSAVPAAAMSSSIGAASASMRGRRSSMRFGVNSRLTRLRSRVWSGGLRKSIEGAGASAARCALNISGDPSSDGRTTSWGVLPRRGSRSTVRQSSKLLRYQSAPSGFTCTGALSRSAR